MFSPYKLVSMESNFFEISSNLELAEKLALFFRDVKTRYLWYIDTSRQRMADALKHTSIISLRQPKPENTDSLETTEDWNQIMLISDTKTLITYDIFQELCRWLESAFLKSGATNVEFGRIFFSKHMKNTKIGLHTDEGAYFDYYDRFHFVIEQTDNMNIFHIRDESIELLTGKLYWVNNHVPHWLENLSDTDRINLIVDARLN